MAILTLLLMAIMIWYCAIALLTVSSTNGEGLKGLVQSWQPQDTDYTLVPIPVETRNRANFNQRR
ncbi:hypothetical protein A5482_002675 [Cyanobacterium sp. IPPAS B-1200]|uniref:hypothetical protein n=1 Tax=Cyanobacterium sp. IPPAS B-1200 TaxID=1562720 RepID=UPI0008525CA8|nr:hypothetical protein [Cyanobacterium sp. IPPAS B-1200]OEJ78970.1 hypothetical protein A5482_11785 [Cyanobacterium sp. IPPAS B-1200]